MRTQDDDFSFKLFVEISLTRQECEIVEWLLDVSSKDETRDHLRRTIYVQPDCVFSADGWILKAIPLRNLECFETQVGKILRPIEPLVGDKAKYSFELVEPDETETGVGKDHGSRFLRAATVRDYPSASILVDANHLRRALDGANGKVNLRLFSQEHERGARIEVLGVQDDFYSVTMGVYDSHYDLEGGWRPDTDQEE